ncbi:hypothetical protein DACRYDRAFT_24485 [Dacryopinax primogenitus]|uniref:Uncharacterized protein n=1 Tax=Dacryopinax primogenitus (strain DJM 731) TaxID=1858805 RepID=M5FRP6_DACPD|nr:uncharacterized protein DACRYDRAFT_24485 [Dacryopinax primogenitus]EJT98408.1 hypothetical protein DACRYDRAFT_24485 [Dacryopinax primogenitus]
MTLTSGNVWSASVSTGVPPLFPFTRDIACACQGDRDRGCYGWAAEMLFSRYCSMTILGTGAYDAVPSVILWRNESCQLICDIPAPHRGVKRSRTKS